MKAQIVVRPIRLSELSAECPHPPDHDEYEMYLAALHEEILLITGVQSAVRNESTFTLEIAANSMKAAEALLKPAMVSRVMTKLRLASFT